MGLDPAAAVAAACLPVVEPPLEEPEFERGDAEEAAANDEPLLGRDELEAAEDNRLAAPETLGREPAADDAVPPGADATTALDFVE